MRIFGLIFLFVISMLPVQALAQNDGGFSKLEPLPAAALDDGAPIRMTPEGPAVIQLDQDAASLIVGNPAHATAVLENPRLIMLIPQQPGATKVMALDRSGKAIFNRHVLVGGGKSQFLRINRACVNASTAGCRPVAMYYCPDRCYETTVAGAGAPTGDAAIPAPMGASGASSADVPETVGENPVEVE